jgi:hypothetical protein
MKRFKKEWLLFAVAIVIAVAGLLQFFDEEAYAVGLCNHDNCYDQSGCNSTKTCVCGSTVTTCEAWCPNGPCIQ